MLFEPSKASARLLSADVNAGITVIYKDNLVMQAVSEM